MVRVFHSPSFCRRTDIFETKHLTSSLSASPLPINPSAPQPIINVHTVPKCEDSKRSSHVPEGAVAKLQELIASFGLENAMAQQFVSYQGSKYIMSDVLRLINRDVRQLQVKSQDGNVVGPAVSDTPTGEALAGKNGIFRLLNIIFQERTRQMWIECEQRVTNTPATPNRGTLGRCWEPFWTAVTQHLLDKEYDVSACQGGDVR